MLSYGLRLPVAGALASREAIERVARTAGGCGFSTLWVHDFLVWTRELDRDHVSCGSIEAVEAVDRPPTFHESLTNLAFLAGLTSGSSVRLGVAVLCVPYRHPVIAARQLANIDVLSGGRLILGMGVGAPKDIGSRDPEVLGIPRAGRYDRMEEYVRAMQSIWTEPVSSFDGKFVSFPPTEFYPKPVQKPHPPIWIGGFGPKALRMVASFGTGWLPGMTVGFDEYPKKIDLIHATAKELGRDDFDLTVGVEITGASIASTRDEAFGSARRTLETVVQGYGRGSHGAITMEKIRGYTLIGTPSDILEKVQRYSDAGVSHFEIKFVYHSIDHLIEQMELFGEEVVAHSP